MIRMQWCGLIYAQSNTETCHSRRRYHLPNSHCHQGSTKLVKMHLLVSYPFHLGSWAHQHFKPESKFNYLASAFCGLKMCRVIWGYWGVNPSCACGVGPFSHGDWGAAMASQGVLAAVVHCGKLGCPARGLCGAGVGHLFLGKNCIHLSNYRKYTWWWWVAPAPLPFFSHPDMFISTNVSCCTWTQWCPFGKGRGEILCFPATSGDIWQQGRLIPCSGPGCLWEGTLLYSNMKMFSFHH